MRNLRAAGEGELLYGKRRERFNAIELPDAGKEAILRPYLNAGSGRWASSSAVSAPTRRPRTSRGSLPTIRSSGSRPTARVRRQTNDRPAWTRRRPRGAFVGGVFGLVFVLANAHTPLGPTAASVFRGVGVAGFVVLLAAGRRVLARTPENRRERPEPGFDLFGRRYRQIVAGEVVLLGAGLATIWAIGAPTQAYLPWTVLVVGLHFVAFRYAGVWAGGIVPVAAILIVLGIAGLVMTDTSAVDWIPLVSGVLTGLTLLGGCLTTAARQWAAAVSSA